MKSRTILILWAIAILLGISIFILKKSQSNQAQKATHRAPGQNLLTHFPLQEISTIEISGTTESTTLTKTEDQWTVVQRDSYPANTRNINELLRTLTNLKITQSIKADPSYAPRFGMDKSSTDPSQHGVTATFKSKTGKELTKITFGKNLEATSSSPSFSGGINGRFIRNHADTSGFYTVSEIFATLSPAPKDWLSIEFLQIEKIQSISVTKPNSKTIEWKVYRSDETQELLLGEAHLGRKTNLTAVGPLKILFAYTRFEDLLTEPEAKLTPPSEKNITATIITFEGFHYTLSLHPQTEEADNYLLNIQVSAKLPKTRKKPAGETTEDANIADEFFTKRLKTLTDRLAQTKSLENKTFVISKATAAPLLKRKPSLIQTASPVKPTRPKKRKNFPPN